MTRKYLVWDSESDISDARTIDAVDYDEAAETWADTTDSDSGEYPIAGNGKSVIVAVQQVGDPSNTIYFKVEGEFSASYWAYPTP